MIEYMNLENFKKKCRKEEATVEEAELQLKKRILKFKELSSKQWDLGKGYHPKRALILKKLFFGYVCPICSKPLDEEVIIERTLGVEGNSIYRCSDCKYEYAMVK